MNKRFSLSRPIAAGRDGQPPGVCRVSCNGDFTEKEFKEIVANC